MGDEKVSSDSICNFYKKSIKPRNIRKRIAEENDEDEAVCASATSGESSITQKVKKPSVPDNKLYFSSTGVSSSYRHRGEKLDLGFDSSKEIQIEHDSRATATLETETEFDRDARAIRERALKQADQALKGTSIQDEKVYKGINSYIDYKAGFRREQTVSGEKAGGAHGPLRASAHIRVSARFDYQPDICKDYKETGYCGYGDACKFMHDRGDYKSGWQLEKEWDEAEKARKRRLALRENGEDDADESDEEDSLPFRCSICRAHFKDVKNPVVTQCKHYFCDTCALQHHSKNKKCYLCNKPTLGIFNIAHEIKKKVADRNRD